MFWVDSVLLLLLRWIKHPGLASHSRSFVLVQHHVERNKEGGREVEFLQGGSKDFQEILVPPPCMYPADCGCRHRQYAVGAISVATDCKCVGCYLPVDGCMRLSYLIPDRPQPMAHDLLVLS